MSDITQDSFLTITMVDGKATNTVVSQGSGFGGFGRSGGRGNGDRPGGNRENSAQAAS